MNEHDSLKMEGLLRQKGYTAADSSDEADLLVINTCSVREKSYQKALSEIGRSIKKSGKISKKAASAGLVRPKPMVAVTGCVVAHDGEHLMKRFSEIDIILSPDHIAKLPEMVDKVQSEKGRYARVDFSDLSDYEFPSPLTSMSFQQPEKSYSPKAYMTIMKGCDNACSFCIVPFTRGAEVSRPIDDVLQEIRHLQEEGVREIMLLGQNVNSYGKGQKGLTFPHLLRRIDEETQIDRIRFTSPHPKDLSKELIEEYGKNSKLCPHMHLPLQSGSDRMLKRMRRSYTRNVYLRKVDALRKVLPEVAITTDIIVGFPGETEEDFSQTLSLVQDVGFDAGYSFIYSPRPKTEAANFADDVPPAQKKERFDRLQEILSRVALSKNQSWIGRTVPVLVEGASQDGEGQLMGRDPHGKIVNFLGDREWTGAILDVEVTQATAFSLRGRLQTKETSCLSK
jgi:tRNA-2-methylthio-N6-dimethylallyladenosine synthase